MKLLNKKQRNNGGFSLVELIVVIAIMVVLVAVLAPVFSKYIESSRRSTDVQNAASIAEGVLADVADNAAWYQSYTGGNKDVVKDTPTAIQSTPTVKGDCGAKGGTFVFDYDKSSNICHVYVKSSGEGGAAITTWDLADSTGAENYKNYKPSGN